MKIAILISAITMLFTSYSYAGYGFSKRPVIGLIGASFATCKAPVDSLLEGVGLAGCSYEGLDLKLPKNFLLRHMTVQTTALSGSFSYTWPGTGWQGYVDQFEELVTRTTWKKDGVLRLKHLVIDLTNDCLHSFPCNMQSYEDTTLAAYKTVIKEALDLGVKVYVTALPPYEVYNLYLAAYVYGLQNMIGVNDYNDFKLMHEQALSTIPGVTYIKAYDEKMTTFDGLHPDDKSMRRAARKIALAIIKNK